MRASSDVHLMYDMGLSPLFIADMPEPLVIEKHLHSICMSCPSLRALLQRVICTSRQCTHNTTLEAIDLHAPQAARHHL